MKFSILIFLAIFVIISTLLLNHYYKKQNQGVGSNVISEKKYLHQCNLINEIIDRKVIDSERQCYYDCDDSNIIRVDTSISYPCQSYIMEEK